MAGQWLLGFLCLVLALSAHVPLVRMLAMGIPVYMMAALTVLFASINNQVGFALGCFYGVRMILLVLGSFIVVLTTTSTALTDALRSFVSPLRFCMYLLMISPWCSAWYPLHSFDGSRDLRDP